MGQKVKIFGELQAVTGDGVIADAKQVKNGYVVVKTITERNALSAAVLAEGMPVYVSDEKKTYRWNGNNGWDVEKVNAEVDLTEIEADITALQTKVNRMKEVGLNYDEATETIEVGGVTGEGTGSSGGSYMPLVAVFTGTWSSYNMTDHFHLANISYLIDWGDGTVDTKTNHGYESEGEYTIKVYGEFTEYGILGFPNYAQRAAITALMVNVETIANGAFNSCRNLKKVTLGDRVTTIGENAFIECTALENIVIPKSVTNIGLTAFSDCDALTKVVMEGSVPPAINKSFSEALTVGGSTMYAKLSSLKEIVIPAGSLSSYQKGDGWVDEYLSMLSDPIVEAMKSVGVDFYRGLISVMVNVGAMKKVLAQFQMDGLFEYTASEFTNDAFFTLLKGKHIHFLSGYVAEQDGSDKWNITPLVKVWTTNDAPEGWGDDSCVYFGYAGTTTESGLTGYLFPPYVSCSYSDLVVSILQAGDHTGQ
jgi:hypothetical protein